MHLTPRLVNKEKLLKKYKIRIEKRKIEEEERQKEIEKNFERMRMKKIKPRGILKSSFKSKQEIPFGIIEEEPEKITNKERAKKNWRKLKFKKDCLFAILNKYKKSRLELLNKRESLKNLFKKRIENAIEKLSSLFENLGRDALNSVWNDGKEEVIIYDSEIRKMYNIKESKEYHRSFNFFVQKEVDSIHVNLIYN